MINKGYIFGFVFWAFRRFEKLDMPKERTLRIILVLFMLVNCIAAQPIAQKGVLDLREIDFGRDEMIPLTGEWEFYWKRLYNTRDMTPSVLKNADYINFMTPWNDLPQLYNSDHSFGYATLRLTVICGEDLPSLSLYIPEFYTSYDLYVNGEGFEGNGLVGDSRENSIPNWRPSSKIVELKPGANELILHISNFRHHKGGATGSIVLGQSDEINYWRNFKIGSALFLTGCLLIAGALALGFYWFNPRDYTGLFFFLFCGAYMYRIIGTEEYVIHAVNRNIPWGVTLRFEYISLYASIAFYVYFIRNLLQPRVNLIVFHTIVGVSSVLALLSSFLPTEILTSFLDYYLIFLSISLSYVGLCYLVQINLRHKTTYVTLLGGVMIFIVLTHKMLAYYKLINENFWLTTIGYVVFICSQSVAMTIRFGRNYRESYVAAQIAARTKDQFLNTMSHELRTPMNAIIGTADLLEQTPLDKEQKESVNTIRKHGEALLTIIMDILSLTDASSRKVVIQEQELNINECVDSAYKLAIKEPRERVTFLKSISSEIPEDIVGDSVRLKQVIMHLLSNAFKFTEEGSVSIDVGVLEKTDQHAILRFVIEDSGVGIEKGVLGNIFSVFSQGNGNNNRRFGGTGLGLSVVKQVLDLMGSSLIMESEKDYGTRVSFTLKMNRRPRQNVPERVQLPEKIDPNLRILYAEDNPVNQKLLVMMMKTLGLNVDIAVNGSEAWKKAVSGNYHIILMDLQMPEMDGIEATRKIIADTEKKPVIIAVTANAEVSDKERCFEAGMDDYITKPIKANELKDRILKWQGRSFQERLV